MSSQSFVNLYASVASRFKCNKELLPALESGFPAVWSAAAFPGSKSVCNAWSDAHWQPPQTFPAWLQRLQRRGEIPQTNPPQRLTWHFLIENSKSGGLGRRTNSGPPAEAFVSPTPVSLLFSLCLSLGVCCMSEG